MIKAIDVAARAGRASAPNYLARAAFVAACARAERKQVDELFAKLFPRDEVSPAILSKAASPLATTGDSSFMAELAADAVTDFLGSLQPLSAAANLMRLSSMMINITESPAARPVPIRTDGPSALGFVAEGEPIAVKGFALETVPLGPARKLAAMVAASREALRRANAERVFSVCLREDAAKGLDFAVFSDEDGNGVEIAGLLDGASEVSGSGDALRDLKALASAVSAGGSGQVVFVAGPGLAAQMNLEAAIRATVLPSNAVSDTRLIAVDPLSVAWGADDVPGIDVSGQAVVHMDNAPSAIVAAGPTAAASVRSMWQTDAIITRLTLPIAFTKRRAACVAYTDNIDYLS